MSRLKSRRHAARSRIATQEQPIWRGWGRKRWQVAAVAMAGSVAILIGLWAILFQQRDQFVLTTGVGERQRYELADGSELQLNAGTQLTVSLDRAKRDLTLIRGEALFNVAEDPERPFMVSLGRRQVRVVGTVFAARREDEALTVTVGEGVVEIASTDSATDSEPTATLTANQQFYESDSDSPPVIRMVDARRVLAWGAGRLIYDDATLAEIVADLNRYFETPIAIVGDDAADIRFSGVLMIDTEEDVLRRLERLLPISVTRINGRIELRAAPRQD